MVTIEVYRGTSLGADCNNRCPSVVIIGKIDHS